MADRDTQFGQQYCVFQRGRWQFGLAASAVREVQVFPAMTVVPLSHPLFGGMCYIRGEFLPVLTLNPLLGDEAEALPPPGHMLLIDGPEGTWGLLVDRVTALTTLETSAATEGGILGPWSEAVMGWATYKGEVVRVIDPDGYAQVAERTLNAHWGSEQQKLLVEASRAQETVAATEPHSGSRPGEQSQA